jgi:hypothetical protein
MEVLSKGVLGKSSEGTTHSCEEEAMVVMKCPSQLE